jgi:hypothetical protein
VKEQLGRVDVLLPRGVDVGGKAVLERAERRRCL